MVELLEISATHRRALLAVGASAPNAPSCELLGWVTALKSGESYLVVPSGTSVRTKAGFFTSATTPRDRLAREASLASPRSPRNNGTPRGTPRGSSQPCSQQQLATMV